jgi:hypothetical protein
MVDMAFTCDNVEYVSSSSYDMHVSSSSHVWDYLPPIQGVMIGILLLI